MSAAAAVQRSGGRVPWATEAAWRRLQAALIEDLDRAGDLSAARAHAAALAHARDRLQDLFDHLAAAACGACPDPCCRRAKVWLDFPDLLFIHLNGEMRPTRQLRRDLAQPCRYLGPHGCGLPHRSRPWICSWYVCPALRRALERDLPGGWRQAAALRQRIKGRRAAMLRAYQSALAGASSVQSEAD
jgi:hypothetical protein